MKRAKFVSIALAALLLFALTSPVLATYPADFNFVGDGSGWTVQVGDDDYTDMDDSAGWLIANMESGSLVVRYSPNKTGWWPRLRTPILPEEDIVLLDLAKTPYLHYDFTYEGAGAWMISMYLNWSNDLKFANEMTLQAGKPRLEGDNPFLEDGRAGTYKGVINLNTYIENNKVNLPGMTVNSKHDFTSMHIFMIMGDASSKMTVRELRLSDSAEGGSVAVPAPSDPSRPTTPSKTSDPGTVMLILTGMAGLAGTGLLIKKRK